MGNVSISNIEFHHNLGICLLTLLLIAQSSMIYELFVTGNNVHGKTSHNNWVRMFALPQVSVQ